MVKLTQDIFDTVCQRISDGESLRSVCRDKSMPSKSTVLKRIGEESEHLWSDQYARACEARNDALFEEMLDIADDSTNDYMERERNGDTSLELNGENIQRSRLRVEARKWALSKLNPRKYGHKLDVEHAGDMTVSFITEIEQPPEGREIHGEE